jgi:leader peptidase (prepilin peptidase) / N-methyltransferase
MFDPAGWVPARAGDLRPDPVVLFFGATTIGVVSALSLPWPVAIASTVLGVLMIAGAEVDARTFLLPNLITWGAVISSVVAAWSLDRTAPLLAAEDAIMRAGCIALLLGLFRSAYASIRRREGLGWGDVKLAAAVGGWLPVEVIPFCFGLAASSALLSVLLAHLNGRPVTRATRIPFGAFLCPALWIVFFVERVTR